MGNMALDKSSIGNKSFGGVKFAYKEVTSDGSDLGTPDTWHVGVYRIDSEIIASQPREPIELENGQIIRSLPGTETVELKIESAQLDAALFGFIRRQIQGKFYAAFLDGGLGSAGKRLEFFFAIGEFERVLQWKGKTRRPLITYAGVYNDSSVTPATVPPFAIGVNTNFTVGIGQIVKENET